MLSGRPRRVRLCILSAMALTLAPPCGAHEIPADVAVHAFVKPQGQRLQLLMRVPLAALPDVDYPSRWPGYLDLSRADATLRDAAYLWIADQVALFEGEALLREPRITAIAVSLPSDRSFGSFEGALAHVTGPPLASDTMLLWNQGMLDVLFEYEIQSERSQFSIRPALARLGQRVVTVLRFVPPGGAVRAFELLGDPGLLRLDPRWHQAALQFVQLGFFHILDGTDHLLFLLCLVIPFRRFRALVLVVTSFTVAHSLTLIASAYDLAPDALWFPPLVETLIATSIVYMALENIVSPRLQRRWLLTFAFGLVHGFGFSFALRETLQFAGGHLLASLLSFNVGVELGQLLVLVFLIPTLDALFRVVVAERMGTVILSAVVAHTGWHWMLQRGERLRQFQFQWPTVDALLLAGALRWLMLLLIGAALAFWAFRLLREPMDREAEGRS